MTTSAQEAREALGQRLRELRRDNGLTARELAAREGWHESKVSRIEHGKSAPSPADIRAYCAHCATEDQLPDLLATLHNVDAAYTEWRRLLGTGLKRVQQATLKLEAGASLHRSYEPQIIPGLLQTSDYAAAKLRSVIDFYDLPDDLDAGVAKRMERQQILYKRGHSFHFLIGEKSLYTTVGDDHVMLGQLDRLQGVIGMPRVTLGVIPLDAEAIIVVEAFAMFDTRLVTVEGHSAALNITQPREVELYGRAFDILATQSVQGDDARALIARAAQRRK